MLPFQMLSYDRSFFFSNSETEIHKPLNSSRLCFADDMDSAQELLGNNTSDDVSWLCSLSEPELDMLINLKKLAIQRAKVIGHEKLANKFDLKTLRCLALVVMEYTKGKLNGLPEMNGLREWNVSMDSCNLLKCDSGDTFTVKELKACLEIEEKKKPPLKRQHKD